MLEVLGETTGTSVRLTNPLADGAVTVRLPVIAIAVAGTLTVASLGNLLTTVSVRGLFAVSGPMRPFPVRVSSTRLGASGTYTAGVLAS
jgi:hypothetical protein